MPTAYIGNPTTPGSSAVGVVADAIFLRQASLREAASLEGLGYVGGATNGTAKCRGVIYSKDPATGDPLTLLGATVEVTGVTTNALINLPFAAPIALPPGDYLIGIHAATTTSVHRDALTSVNANFQITGQTYASGAPSSWPGGHTSPSRDWYIYGYYTNDGTLEVHTFGRTTLGGTTANMSGNRRHATAFTLTEDATISHLVTLVTPAGAAGTKVRGTIYADTGTGPGALLALTEERIGIWRGERLGLSFASPVVLAAGTYYLGLHTAGIIPQTCDAGVRKGSIDTYSDGTDDPWSSGLSDDAFELVIFAAYTPGGAPPPATPRVIAPIWIIG